MPAILGMGSEELERLAAFVRRRVASAEDSEDILQDVFVALCRRWNIGEAVEDAAAWLFRAAANRIVDWYRSKARRKAAPLETGDDVNAGFLFELADAKADTPDHAAEISELRSAISKAIAALPGEQREVFLMHEVDGMRFEDMAAATGTPLNTLLSRKRYAVLKLREMLRRHLAGESEE